jgi:hypothetical protein
MFHFVFKPSKIDTEGVLVDRLELVLREDLARGKNLLKIGGRDEIAVAELGRVQVRQPGVTSNVVGRGRGTGWSKRREVASPSAPRRVFFSTM